MMRFYILILGLFVLHNATGQTLSHEPTFIYNDMIWNPGSTAERDFLEFGAFYRNQWSGFDGSPRTFMAHIEYPFQYQNASVGGYIYADRSGIIDYVKASFSYAYKIKLGFSRNDRLSLGIAASASQFQINTDQIRAVDIDDENLYNYDGGGIKPNMDFGLMYISNTKLSSRYRQSGYYFIGLSANSLINGLDIYRNNDQTIGLNSNLHSNAIVGANIPLGYVELLAKSWFSYTNNNSYRVGVSGDLKFDLLTIGVGGASDGSVGLKFGTELKSKWLSDGFLRMGIAAFGSVSKVTLNRNPTLEFYLSYAFKTNWDY